MNKQEQLTSLMRGLRQAVPETSGVMIAATDGLPIVHDFPESEAGRIAAMAATTLGLGKRVVQATNLGELTEASIRGENGYLLIYGCGSRGVLALTAPASANLGLINLEARLAASEIADVLG